MGSLSCRILLADLAKANERLCRSIISDNVVFLRESCGKSTSFNDCAAPLARGILQSLQEQSMAQEELVWFVACFSEEGPFNDNACAVALAAIHNLAKAHLVMLGPSSKVTALS